MINIKQAAEMFDLTIDTLRYYGRIGVITPVTRDHKGYRVFKTKDLNAKVALFSANDVSYDRPGCKCYWWNAFIKILSF